jgi:predicted MPP superfamily phosphohydrolase
LVLPRLAPEFNNYRIVQISDFHIGTWINRSRLLEAVEQVNRQNADLVVITGDFVTFTPEQYAADLVEALKRIRSKDGSLAILGNHDHWANPGLVRKVIHAAGVIELNNTVHSLRRGDACLHIAGIDDFMDHHDRLDLVLAQLPPDGAAILLAHEPDFADRAAATGRFDLQLSGHTHGGQICLPRIGPPFLPRYGRKYVSGLYQVQQMYQYTNRGLGTAELEVRVNCPAEISVFTLAAHLLD